jgi:putative endonuclease
LEFSDRTLEAGGEREGVLFREKQIKKWRREKKLKLVDSFNPGWKDLSEEL